MIARDPLPKVPRLVGRCMSCGMGAVVVFDVESADRRICVACLDDEIAVSIDVPMYEGASLVEWMACHSDHRRYVNGCPFCGAGKVS